ncbi:adenylosuccinate synthase [Chitinophaga agrisoli]|uniref:Adenylosuccinate synthetase n=1 Tax=Chitinophaga agrisoli TaxID=2607653 RepID=A0A5B2VP96_9BACT|nr:adenylosuccinate synthase [Chitinophaga agrisoli]KAA2240624.1 adenylosuccinate synthase [Chitinophaga agrisoli]
MIDVLLGLQWGDEGKGKIVDYFAGKYDVIARFQGGPNAGHTLYINDKKVVLHTIPSGVFHKNTVNLIGNGVVLDPVTFRKECDEVTALGVNLKANLFIAERTHVIVPTHRALDKASETAKGHEKIGSTLKGIGPAYMDKTGRNGLRVGDILSPDFKDKYEKLKAKHMHLLQGYDFLAESGILEDVAAWEKDFFTAVDFLKEMNIVNGEYFLNEKLKAGQQVLAEGAQGSMLDVDFGTYPFVTSSSTISAGVCTGLGIAPKWIREVIGVTKAYCTRVGGGPFPTELHDATGEKLREIGREFGATTGRPRRCGWIDLVALDYTCMLSGVTQLVMTKSDVLDAFDEVYACTAYEVDGTTTRQMPFQLTNTNVKPVWEKHNGWSNEAAANSKHYNELPGEMKAFVKAVEDYLHVPVKFVSNGPGRDQILEQ